MRRVFSFVTSMIIVAGCHVVTARGLTDGETAVGGIARVSIVDRHSGAEIVPHFYRGEYWVAGTPGATYSISIRNRLSERLLAVASVDGVNVVSGATAAWDQTGYVFSPNQRYEITGWRKSDSEVAAFTFTASPHSYAELTGRPANVGIIGVALFRERQPEPEVAVPAPVAPASEMDSNAGQSRLEAPAKDAVARAPKLGTGHGDREYSHVDHTDFQRLQPEPNEIVRIRYDSYDNLVAMGVIKRPGPSWPRPNPSPDSPVQQYVPDPPGTNAR